MLYDTIIIGASAAGMSAAIYAARRGLNFIILAKDIGGEMLISGDIGNYPGVKDTEGVELTQKFKEQMDQYKVEIHEGEVIERVEKKGNIVVVKSSKLGEENVYEAKSVIVATGIHPRELNVPGEKELRGKGVTYCTVCDGPLFKDKVTATIGGGNSALESALMMNEIAKKVYLINIHDKFYKGDAVLIKKVENEAKNVEIITEAETQKILGNDKVTGIEFKDKKTGEIKTLEAQGIMVHIGMIPNSGMVEVEKSKFKEIVVDKMCRTSEPGIFAAGDVTDVPYKQIAIATGSGVCAALAMVDYVNKWEE